MTNWIKGEQLPDGSVKINNKIYKHDPDDLWADYVIKDGWVFCADHDHSGQILMTERVAKKWDVAAIRMEPDEHAEYIEAGLDPRLTHELLLDHAFATVNGNGEEILTDSPFGQLYGEPFTAWFNNIDPRFFSDLPEEDKVEIQLLRWSD